MLPPPSRTATVRSRVPQAGLLETHWPSFTPFLLALLDDTDDRSRAHGLRAAEVFVRKCPPVILAERGIGRVLEEAILPTLQFLPSHTPEAESAKLLEPAYETLVLLARTRFSYDYDVPSKISLLGKLLREGIFSAYSHASEYPRVVHVLVVQARSIIDELGIYATKYLKVRGAPLPPQATRPAQTHRTRANSHRT